MFVCFSQLCFGCCLFPLCSFVSTFKPRWKKKQLVNSDLGLNFFLFLITLRYFVFQVMTNAELLKLLND